MAPAPKNVNLDTEGQYEGGTKKVIEKSVKYTSSGMAPTDPDGGWFVKKVSIGRPMEVMCRNCGDVMRTTVVKASTPCWKNWCCAPCPGVPLFFVNIFLGGCKE